MARRMNAAWLAAIGTGLMMMAAQATCGLDQLLEIERRTMKEH